MDSKKAKTSGGKKKRTTAKVSTPTSAEKSKVNKVTSKKQERGKSTLKNLDG